VVGDANFATGAVAATTDGGATWTSQALPTGITSLSGVSCTGTEDCWAVGEDVVQTAPGPVDSGVIVSTTDGGSTWTDVTVPDGVSAVDGVSCAAALTCTAVGTTTTDVVILGLSEGATVPTITAFTPRHRGVGATVTITGTGLSGATAVDFNGTAAAIVSDSSGTIVCTVPRRATSGPISVTTPGGTVVSASRFIVRHRHR
jgi:photosystem II stability/assembly factor-like uncharacterized protein